MERPSIFTRAGNPVTWLSARFSDTMPRSADGADVLYHEYGAQLRRTPDGRFILNVLCGTVALYDVDVELTAEEQTAWESTGGEVFIHRLADDICGCPSGFATRFLPRN